MDTYTHYCDGIDSPITLTAEREDTEPHRIARLHRVIGYVAAIGDINEWAILHDLVSLHDHKGELTVTWKGMPGDIELQAFRRAWGNGIGDGDSSNVAHVGINGERY